jgi:hypothetical protein
VPATRVVALFSGRDRVLGKTAQRSLVKACLAVERYTVDAPHFALQTVPDQIIRCLTELGVLDERGCA